MSCHDSPSSATPPARPGPCPTRIIIIRCRVTILPPLPHHLPDGAPFRDPPCSKRIIIIQCRVTILSCRFSPLPVPHHLPDKDYNVDISTSSHIDNDETHLNSSVRDGNRRVGIKTNLVLCCCCASRIPPIRSFHEYRMT